MNDVFVPKQIVKNILVFLSLFNINGVGAPKGKLQSEAVIYRRDLPINNNRHIPWDYQKSPLMRNDQTALAAFQNTLSNNHHLSNEENQILWYYNNKRK